MKMFLTGAGGMLGSAMVPALIGAGHLVWATDLVVDDDRPWGPAGPVLGPLDARSADQIARAVDTIGPDMVLHLAAETDLETCELDPVAAAETNALATRVVAEACVSAGIPMTYISTAGVFDGSKRDPYVEDDPAYPANVYGQTKLDGEHYVRELLDEHYIIRAGWMVGGGRKDHKFVARILKQLAAGASTIYAVGDKRGTPTYAPDFSRCFQSVLAGRHFGTFHMACEGEGTRLDVARRILDVLGRDDVELVEVGSEHFAEQFFAPRAASEIMRNQRLDELGLNTMRPWPVALEEYLLTHFTDLSRPGALASTISEA